MKSGESYNQFSGSGDGSVERPHRTGAVLPSTCTGDLIEPSAQNRQTLWNKYLLPGDLFATKVPHVIATVLGSCVAVCLWDPVLRAGGMNHFMLPSFTDRGEPTNRYGDIATRNLVVRMESLGCKRINIRARLYGGGNVLCSSGADEEALIGMKNVRAARDVLAKEGLTIEGEHVGDMHGRKLKFNTNDGSLTLEYLNSMHNRKGR